jgi:carbamoyltransferase
MPERIILGIHDGHNCGAALVCDGRVIAAVNEERLTRRKNDVGYPRRAIEEVLAVAGVEARRVSGVAYASNFMHARSHLEDIATWYAVGIKEQRDDARRPQDYGRRMFEVRRRERIDEAVQHLGVPAASVHFVEHHLGHLAAAYYTAPAAAAGRRILGLTCDGAGDNVAATVSVCDGGKITRIAATDRHASLGKIYSRVTYLMGMTPWEHEYKIMGLAPYSDPERSDRAAEPFRKLLRLSDDGLCFERAGDLSTNYCYEYLREHFERVRFDTIAGATQRFTEEMLVAWIRSCIKHTGVADLVCGGGVFMNVKANMLIAALPEVRSIYVMPSAADESLAIGAALHRHYETAGAQDFRSSVLANLYLGGAENGALETQAIEAARRELPLSVQQPNDINEAVAGLLADGEVVATCRGRMEWGARSLGNRSILSRADDSRRVDLINSMIKMRDFWMPFAPSVIEESAPRYFADRKDIRPQFMTFAFPTSGAGQAELVAASHPKDRTIRPQLVTRAANPDYHATIAAYERRTGSGAILNTSFNLHGEPIVYSAADALRVLKLSALKHLALNRHLVSKVA